jgi:hypothetical protein
MTKAQMMEIFEDMEDNGYASMACVQLFTTLHALIDDGHLVMSRAVACDLSTCYQYVYNHDEKQEEYLQDIIDTYIYL